MFKIVSMLFPFLKELVFDSKEEYDFSSSKFNSRKFLVFVLLITLISSNVFLVTRLYKLASTNVELKEKVMEFQMLEKVRTIQEKKEGPSLDSKVKKSM